MMGYRDPNDNEAEGVAEYWDMVLKDFGVSEYVRIRYEESEVKNEATPDCPGDCPVLDNAWFKHSHSLPV